MQSRVDGAAPGARGQLRRRGGVPRRVRRVRAAERRLVLVSSNSVAPASDSPAAASPRPVPSEYPASRPAATRPLGISASRPAASSPRPVPSEYPRRRAPRRRRDPSPGTSAPRTSTSRSSRTASSRASRSRLRTVTSAAAARFFCRVDIPRTDRGDAAAATWIFRRDVDFRKRRVRGDAAATTRTVGRGRRTPIGTPARWPSIRLWTWACLRS